MADKKAAEEKYKQDQEQRELERESDWANEVMAMSDEERLALHEDIMDYSLEMQRMARDALEADGYFTSCEPVL